MLGRSFSAPSPQPLPANFLHLPPTRASSAAARRRPGEAEEEQREREGSGWGGPVSMSTVMQLASLRSSNGSLPPEDLPEEAPLDQHQQEQDQQAQGGGGGEEEEREVLEARFSSLPETAALPLLRSPLPPPGARASKGRRVSEGSGQGGWVRRVAGTLARTASAGSLLRPSPATRPAPASKSHTASPVASLSGGVHGRRRSSNASLGKAREASSVPAANVVPTSSTTLVALVPTTSGRRRLPTMPPLPSRRVADDMAPEGRGAEGRGQEGRGQEGRLRSADQLGGQRCSRAPPPSSVHAHANGGAGGEGEGGEREEQGAAGVGFDSTGPWDSHQPCSMLPTPSTQSASGVSKKRPPSLAQSDRRSRRKSSTRSLGEIDLGFMRWRGRTKTILHPEHEVEESMESVMTALFLHAVRSPGGELDRKLRQGAGATLQSVSVISALFTSQPMSYTVGLGRMQAGLVVLAVIFLAGILYPAQLVFAPGLEHIIALRVQALSLSSPASPILRAGLLKDGCEAVYFLNGNCSVRDGVYEQYFTPTARANGWFIHMDDSVVNAREGEVGEFGSWQFELEDGRQYWECLLPNAGPECRAQVGGRGGLQPSFAGIVGHYNQSVMEMKFAVRPGIHTRVFAILPLLKGIGFFAAAVCGAFHMEPRAVWWVAGAYWTAGLALLAAAFTLGPSPQASALWPWWAVNSVECGGVGTALLRAQRHAVLLLALDAAANFLLLLQVYLPAQPDLSVSWQAAGLVGDGVVLCLCVGLGCLRWRLLITSERLIQRDKESYDAEWEKVLAHAGEELDELQGVVDSLARKVSTVETPRQRVRGEGRAGAAGLNDDDDARNADHGRKAPQQRRVADDGPSEESGPGLRAGPDHARDSQGQGQGLGPGLARHGAPPHRARLPSMGPGGGGCGGCDVGSPQEA